MREWLKKHAGDILTGIGCVGMVAAIVEAIQETRNEPRKPRSIKEEIEHHPKTVIFAATSLGCFIGARCTSRKQAIGAEAAILALNRGFAYYKERAADLAGEELDGQIVTTTLQEARDAADGNPPWDEDQRFCIEGHGQIFKCTMLDVVKAEYHFNRYLSMHARATLNDMYDFFSVDLTEDGDDYGWDMMGGDFFKGHWWVDFEHEHRWVADGALLLCIIKPKQKANALTIFREKRKGYYGNITQQNETEE